MPQIEGPTRTIPPVMLWLTALLIVGRAGLFIYEKIHPPLPSEQIAWKKPEEVDLKSPAATAKPVAATGNETRRPRPNANPIRTATETAQAQT